MSSNHFSGEAGQFPSSAASPQTHFDLRPLSTGEVLDRTFQLYRSRFTLFAGLALLPAAVSVVTSALRLAYAGHQDMRVHTGAAITHVQIISGSMSLISGLISIVLYGITQAATTWAVSAVYLGEAASIKPAYQRGFEHWLRYTLIVLRQVWAFLWLPMVLFAAAVAVPVALRRYHGGGLAALTVFLLVLGFLSLIYGLWAYIRLSLAIPASVVESLKARAAVRRSAQLLESRKVRIFLLLLLLFALYMVIGVIQSPLLIFSMRARGAEAFVTRSIGLAVSFVAGTLVGPVGAIAVCLFYFDERVRREGFDIEWMMRKLAPADASPAAVATEPALPPPTQENSAESV